MILIWFLSSSQKAQSCRTIWCRHIPFETLFAHCCFICSGVGGQCRGELGHQSKGLCLLQLQPQARLPEPLRRSLWLPDVAGCESILSCPRILPGVPLTKRHSPGGGMSMPVQCVQIHPTKEASLNKDGTHTVG